MEEEGSDHEPLLVADDHGAWDDVEIGATQPAVTVQQLIAQNPDHVIRFITKKGVVKLGEFKLQDALMLAAMDGDPFVTMGSSCREIDYEHVWSNHISKLAKKKRGLHNTGWSRHVTVEAFVVNIKDAAKPGDCCKQQQRDSSSSSAGTLHVPAWLSNVEGLVNPLLCRYNAGGCHYSVFGLPAVQAVLEFKWRTFAGGWVRFEFMCFLTWLVSFSVFLLVFQLLTTATGIVTVVCECLALVAMLPFVVIEFGSMQAYARGWLSLWNALDVITYALQIGITVLHLGRIHLESGWLSVLVAFSVVLGGSSSFSIIDSMKQVVVDIRMYLLYLLLMMWGFACAYCILFRRDQEHEQFSDVGHSMLTMFTYALGGVELDIMLGSSNPEASIVLSLLYQFAMGTVLMSLLTGVMAQSMYKATAHEDLKRLLSKAAAVDELESTIPSFIEKRMHKNYPAYVHVLRIDPLAMDDGLGDDDGTNMWHQQAEATGPQGAQMGSEPSKGAAAGPPGSSVGGGDVQVLMSEVQSLKQQLQTLTDLLHTAVPSLPPSPLSGRRSMSVYSEDRDD
ncbi:hypothetical protein COO60DRAFT_1693077 [Scenedesmus sp. NREL 46B-D3]|nr:hypothetical protein COO60DRAFT_1693077 [Scenedesmus sp. NREL 46B-D3]